MLSKYLNLIRLNKPQGIFLLLLPCLFGIFLAKTNATNFSSDSLFKLILLFSFGSLFMRSAGCIVNDIFDREIDAKIARTKLRPLASGAIKTKEALFLLFILLFCSFLIWLQFNFYTKILAILALLLAIIYPLMKRITFYPQIFLGIAFNWGILMADVEINHHLFASTFALFFACIIWTLIYDSFYAFQDIEDDLKIGVKSSAIKFSLNPKKILTMLTFAMFLLIFLAGFMQSFNKIFYGINFVAFLYQIFLIFNCNYKNQNNCLIAFKANIWVGILILLAIAIQ